MNYLQDNDQEVILDNLDDFIDEIKILITEAEKKLYKKSRKEANTGIVNEDLPDKFSEKVLEKLEKLIQLVTDFSEIVNENESIVEIYNDFEMITNQYSDIRNVIDDLIESIKRKDSKKSTKVYEKYITSLKEMSSKLRKFKSSYVNDTFSIIKNYF